MKTQSLKLALPAALALLCAGQVHADVGILDGADDFRNFQSTKSRAEVRAELEADRAAGYQVTDGTDFPQPNIGAHGVPGSRYSTKTREEVNSELQEYKRTHQPNSPDDIYFGA